MKTKTVTLILAVATALTSALSASAQPPVAPPEPALDRKGWMEMPGHEDNAEYKYYSHEHLPSDSTLRNYSMCIDTTKSCALWVAYPLHDCYQASGNRTEAFDYDPQVPTTYQPALKGKEKYSAGFDRGHQLPSADRNKTKDDNRTTFYSTNMSPQRSTLNQAKWGQLEDQVRKWKCGDTLYVVTGSVFDTTRTIQTALDGSGTARPIPTHYYKVLLRTKKGDTKRPVHSLPADSLQSIGFLFDHDDPTSWDIPKSVRSIEEIEQLTGQDFFVNVPNAPKTQKDPTLWTGLK